MPVSTPRVTVLMAVHNAEHFLSEAIESVLAQTLSELELLIVDDASTDRSRAIAASFADPRIRIVATADNVGLTAALNRGLSMIASEYVARLDADDVALPKRLERQIGWLDQHRDTAVLGVQAIPIDARGRRIRRVSLLHPQWRRPCGGLALAWYRAFDTPFVHSGVMFRRAVVEAAGGYDEAHPLEQDAELWLRIGRSHALANLDEELVALRCHGSSMTADPRRREREGYAARKTAIVHALLRELLADTTVPSRWAELWVRANDPWTAMPRAELLETASMLATCAEAFFAAHPEARHNREIAAHRVSMLARLVDKADRPTIVQLCGEMFRIDRKTAMTVLPRVGPFLLLGHQTLPLWRRLA